jgi:hypothetical protein
MPDKTDIQTTGLVNLMADIKRGYIRIPDFQRDYIWSQDQNKELLDSVWNGYPLGSILLWKTSEQLKSRDPLNLRLPEPAQNQDRCYLLDGQQRLISLYSVLHGKLQLGRKLKGHVFFNLDKKEFVICSEDELQEKPLELKDGYLPLTSLFAYTDEAQIYPIPNPEILRKLQYNADRIITYTTLFQQFSNLSFPAITNGQSLAIACKIFERLNNTGTRLTVVDLMVAITYKRDFNLRDKLTDLISELDDKYYGLSERAILQCFSACLQHGTEKEYIIDSADEIHPKWNKVTESVALAIAFLQDNCSVPVSKFLPYEIILAPLSYFFYLHGGKPIDRNRVQKLIKYFWLSMFSERYTSSQSSRAEDDIANMGTLHKNSDANLFDYYEGTVTKEMIKKTDLSFGSSLAKTILCFMASKNPIEFKNDLEISLDQTFGEANQTQVHHFPN